MKNVKEAERLEGRMQTYREKLAELRAMVIRSQPLAFSRNHREIDDWWAVYERPYECESKRIAIGLGKDEMSAWLAAAVHLDL